MPNVYKFACVNRRCFVLSCYSYFCISSTAQMCLCRLCVIPTTYDIDVCLFRSVCWFCVAAFADAVAVVVCHLHLLFFLSVLLVCVRVCALCFVCLFVLHCCLLFVCAFLCFQVALWLRSFCFVLLSCCCVVVALRVRANKRGRKATKTRPFT